MRAGKNRGRAKKRCPRVGCCRESKVTSRVGKSAVRVLLCLSQKVYGLNDDVKEEHRQGVASRFVEEGKEPVCDNVNVNGQ